MDYREYFKNKKVTQIGLGILGRGVGDAEFLAEMGSELIVTDLKTADELRFSVDRLKKFKNITFRLGGHRPEDFKDRDFILKGPGVPLDSPYIAEARKNGIPIEMDASLFVKLAPKGVVIIGVTGTRGKTTTTMMIYNILKESFRQSSERQDIKVHLGGNIKDIATLPLLKKVDPPAGGEDYVVMELDSWQLQGFGEAKISPHIAVFTNFYPDHLNYYGSTTLTTGDSTASTSSGQASSLQVAMKKYFADKANIFKYQKAGDILIAGEGISEASEHYLATRLPSGAISARADDFPEDWRLKIPGNHNKANAMCAILAARALKIPEAIIKKSIESFIGVSGRLELIREINGVKIFNDTTSTTPTATVAALNALDPEGKRHVVLIMGGADKGLDMVAIRSAVHTHCKKTIFLSGTGTERIRSYTPDTPVFESLKLAINAAMVAAAPGDVVLFSPAFASFGMFKNEYDRGEQFCGIVKSLKLKV